MLSRLISKKYKVAISGDGGDELFSIMEVEKRGEYVDNEFELKQNDYKQKIIQLKSVS